MSRRRRHRRALALALLLLTALGLVLSVRFRFVPMLRTIAEIQVTNAASNALADAVNQQLATGTADYDQLIHFEKDTQGRITALRTDVRQVATLKAEVFDALDGLVDEVEIRALGVPLGSLLLPALFAGHGPRLPVKVATLTMTGADLHSSISECGINQSLLKLWFTFSVDIRFLTPAGTQTTSVTNDVVLVETVIVGSVPEMMIQ